MPRVTTPLLRSSPPINSISHRLFRCRHSNSRDAVASSPFYSHPAARQRPGKLARRQDIYIMSFPPCSLSATQYSYQHLSLYIFSLPRFNFILGADFTFLCVYRKIKFASRSNTYISHLTTLFQLITKKRQSLPMWVKKYIY